MVQPEYLGSQIVWINVEPLGDGMLRELGAAADADHARKAGVGQSLGDETGGIGEIQHPRVWIRRPETLDV